MSLITNIDYWNDKIRRNVERDRINNAILSEDGWNVITVWECELKKKMLQETMKRIEAELLLGKENHE